MKEMDDVKENVVAIEETAQEHLTGTEGEVVIIGDDARSEAVLAAIAEQNKVSGIVIPLQQKPVEVDIDHETSAYLRLTNIYEGDIELEPGQYVQSFILKMVDLQGTVFMCPVYTHDNLRDGVRKALTRLKPIILSQFDKEATIKAETKAEVIDIAEGNHNGDTTH